MTAIPSQEWTEQDERALQAMAQRGGYGTASIFAGAFAREINRQRDEVARLRDENERMTKHVESLRQNARDVDWHGGLLRTEVTRLAATREVETPEFPDEVRWEIRSAGGWGRVGPQILMTREDADRELAKWWELDASGGFYLVRSTTSRSRVSDNGK